MPFTPVPGPRLLGAFPQQLLGTAEAVAERLAQLAGDEHLALIKLDSYYVEFHDTPIEGRRAFNYDHPDAFAQRREQVFQRGRGQ